MITSLQIGLIVLGVAVLVAVWAYLRWQARRLSPRRADSASHGANPAPAAEQRREPVLDDPPPLSVRAPQPQTVLSPRIDAIVTLPLDKPVTGDAVLQSLPGSRRVGSKPFSVEGLPLDAAADAWELPRPGQRYAMLRTGIQLANRAGALNEIEYSEFVQKLQAWAEHWQAALDFPDMRQVVQQARELDRFAAAHDAQLVLCVRARGAAWSPGYVAQHAARFGLVPGGLPGRWVLPAAQEGAAPLVVLQFETQAALADEPELAVLREVRLLLEVTHVPREEQAWSRLRELSAALAQAMDGVVCDDSGQMLSAEALDRIGADIEVLYEALQAQGVSAGSPEARRLFS
jgi:hypothetical protein